MATEREHAYRAPAKKRKEKRPDDKLVYTAGAADERVAPAPGALRAFVAVGRRPLEPGDVAADVSIEGAHRMAGTSPFGVIAYGYGPVGSYAVAGGADVRKIYTSPPLE